MPHFFINSENVSDDRISVCDKENYSHIAKSLRARAGEKLVLIDENQIQYETLIEKITCDCIEARIEKSYKSVRKLDFELYLAQSPLRNNDIVMEKAAELGVAGVYPLMTDNCAVSFDTVKRKIPRWQKIMYEASKQCERADIPVCFEPVTLETLPSLSKGGRGDFTTIAFCERHTELTLRNVPLGKSVLIIVGPEGGFSKREFEFFDKNNIPMITLGNLILKAETAVIAGLGNVIYEHTR
ncbi:MAG: 16S rRNA (uracil(1498)-N(3))-methyltransferase [Heliobacteriaceae bacterium]|jgi:16S rRNA (uracil1498-N3)-methyltransferase|nr:16S rRNA (uracil(1498)-N(3))-methyltransferase [Heliobacteriaceae bacterium]